MEVLLLAVMGAVNIMCFMIGAKVGQTVSKGKEIEIPSPSKAVQGHKERKAAEKEKSKIDTILRNIDSYNGTGQGQEDIPR